MQCQYVRAVFVPLREEHVPAEYGRARVSLGPISRARVANLFPPHRLCLYLGLPYLSHYRFAAMLIVPGNFTDDDDARAALCTWSG